jgi:nicotinamide-nucleotide amidase
VSPFPKKLVRLAEAVLDACRAKGLKLATAESCTGGLVAGCLTAVAGSSDVVERGFVVYANAAKVENLGVPEAMIAAHGAVSEDVARAMAEGALVRSRADITTAVTGIAGPGGETPTKPVGLVHVAVARKGRLTVHERHVIAGDRDAVRLESVAIALRMLKRQAETEPGEPPRG